MSESTPTLQTLDTTTVQQEWEALLGQVARRQTRVLVEEDGLAVAALIPVADLQRLAQLDEQRAQFLETLDEIQAAFADIPDEELEREIAAAIAAVRAEGRGENGR